MKLILVTVGEYSDYQIIAIFDEEHRKEAEETAKLIGGDIEEGKLELNVFNHDEPPKGKEFFSLTMYKDGRAEVDTSYPLLASNGKRFGQYYSLIDHEGYKHLRKSTWRLTVQMYAKSKEHAVKVAGEIRTQLLAGNKPKYGYLP